MKKTGTILISVIITLIVVAGGIFAAWYFLKPDKDTKKETLTYSQAAALVDEVYNTVILQGQGNAKASFTEQEFDGEFPDVAGAHVWVDAYIKYAQAFMHQETKMDKWYKGANKYVYAKIVENSVIFQTPTQFEGSDYFGGEYIKFTKASKTEWTVSYYLRYKQPDGESNIILFHFEIEGGAEKVTRRVDEQLETNLTSLQPATTKEEIKHYGFFDFNKTKGKKVLVGWPDASKAQFAPYGDVQVLSDDEVLTQATNLYNQMGRIMFATVEQTLLDGAQDITISV